MTETITLSDKLIAKAERLLVEQRVHVALPTGPLVALVDGMNGTYRIQRGPTGLHCTCPARGVCAHLLAIAYCTTKPEREPAA